MEPVTLVVTALVAGATAGITNTASTVISDAYQGLKTLVIALLGRHGTREQTGQQLIDNASASEQDKTVLAELLARTDVDEATTQAAQRLLDLLEAHKAAKFTVDASQAKGVVIGDHSTQHNTFN